MTLLVKEPNESELDFHKRLIYGKLVDKTLNDFTYSDLSEILYGRRYAEDVARRMIYGSRRTLELLEEDALSAGAENDDGIDSKIYDFKKERQKLFDERAALNTKIRDRARQEEVNEIIERVIQSGDLPLLEYDPYPYGDEDNDLLISLNDMHYGIDVHNAWNTYNPEICKEMLNTYLDAIVKISETHGSENCYVYNNGDTISGNIHKTLQLANKENAVKQVMGASELISDFLAALGNRFAKVTYVSVAGNHSRLSSKEESPIDERLDDIVPWYLKARLAQFPNIDIDGCEKIDSTMYLLDVRGKTYCGVHGDFDDSETNILRLQTMAGVPLYGVLLGHKHRNAVGAVQGIKTIRAGSFVGVDNFCISKRLLGRPEQLVCVCDKHGIVCHYDVPLLDD